MNNEDNLDYLDTVEIVEHVDNMVSQSGKLKSNRIGSRNFWINFVDKIIQDKTILDKKLETKH